MVNLSRERHESLLESEMVHFARALEPHPITLQEILAHRNADVLRKFLLEELPIRFARRVELIERQPAWDRTPHLRQVRKVYADGFQMLRMVSQPEKDKFRRALQRITHRHDSVLKHVVRGTRHMKRSFGLSDDDANVFLNEFLTQRIGTDILTSQYLALTQPRGATSVIDPVCEPFVLVQEAAQDAVRLCRFHYGHSSPVDVMDIGQVHFPFIPKYLKYIMLELIKNSLRAVVEKHGSEHCGEKPIRVVVTGDDKSVVIRVSDAGGGIPLGDMAKVWSYVYTTAKPPPEDERFFSLDFVESDDDSVAPMAGFGCGLPLSRTYATYVGGRLELSSMPHHGCDAYLYLSRLGDSPEWMKPQMQAAPLPSRGFLLHRQ